MRRLFAVLVVLLAATVLAGLAPPAIAAPVTYVAPVEGRVVDGFRPPSTPYGRGNRGLTYETAPGGPARAAAAGRVTFAGQVGGALHVVVQHADGVRTTYAFLRSVLTRVGATVKQGERVGTAASSLHFGARIGDAYIDPAILLASGPPRVHLVPDGEFSEAGAGDDRRSLFEVVQDVVAVPAAALHWARSQAADLGREAVEHLITVLDAVVNLGQMAGSFAALAAALADILQSFIEPCTSPDVATKPVTDRRIAVFVAGLGSSGDGSGTGLSQRFPVHEMYAVSEVYNFSYRGGRKPQRYEASDTVGDLRDRASELRDLLDQIARDHPGVPVDLIAHSQGGLIAREALAHDYDGPNHTLPTVAHFVTLGTPHHGADVATIGNWLRWTPEGRALLTAGTQVNNFDLNGKGLRQLAEDSDFIMEMNRRELRDGVPYTSIGAARDIVVPGVRARLAGASNVLVDSSANPFSSHSALTTSKPAHRELALALNDQPPTCQSVAATAVRAFTAAQIANFEDGAGRVLAGAAAAP